MSKLKITEMERLSADAYRTSAKLPLILVLDSIRSMNNIGSIFRSADAFRIEGLILCGITARPPHPDLPKTARGAEDRVPWRDSRRALAAGGALPAKGYTVLALEQAHESLRLDRFVPEPGARYALVLGNEVKGVAEEVVAAADHCLEIPQYGTKHSLNVSVAAGIALWQLSHPLFPQLDR